MLTIIDLLKRGNQELFHSAMIGWLLDPHAKEHGLGSKFADSLAVLLREKYGRSNLQEFLTNSRLREVRTEYAFTRVRYDIAMFFDGDEQPRVVIENKTKSIGEGLQLKRYLASADPKVCPRQVIALGLTDVSFALEDEDRVRYPLVLYADILELVKNLPPISSEPFRVLTEQYVEYLERELTILRIVLSMGTDGGSELPVELQNNLRARGNYGTENDTRFLNLYFLQKFAGYLDRSCFGPSTRWALDKNMISGVWLADFRMQGERRRPWKAWVSELPGSDSSFWFHIELTGGVLASSDETVGSIQLRSGMREGRDSITEAIRANVTDAEIRLPYRRVPERRDTFYLAHKALRKQDLTFANLESALANFADLFCQ